MNNNFAQAAAEPAIDARMLRTRAALEAALLALVERKPFDEITVRDIVAEAGVGYATFFRHYPSKAALLDDIAAEQIGNLMALSVPAMEASDTRTAAVAVATYVAEHRALWAALLTGGAAGAMREQFARLARGTAPEVAPASKWLPVDLGILFGVTATVEILGWWLRQDQDFPIDRIAEVLDRLVMTPTVGALSQ